MGAARRQTEDTGEATTSDRLTIAEIAKRLGIPESSARYYRDRFEGYVPYMGEGRTRRYPPEAVEVLRVAATLSRSGTPADQVETELRRRFPLVGTAKQQDAAATQQQTDAEPQDLVLADDAATMRALLADLIRASVQTEVEPLRAEIAGLRAEVARLTEELTTRPPVEPPQGDLVETPPADLVEPPPVEPETPQDAPVEPETPPRPWWAFWRA